MKDFFNILLKFNNITLSSIAFFVGVFILLIGIIVVPMLKNNFFKVNFDEKWFGQLIGSFFVISLSLVADNTIVYIISVIVIATLVTKMEFLLWVLTLIGNRVELGQAMLGIEAQRQNNDHQENVDPNKVIEIVDKLEKTNKKLEKLESESKSSLLFQYYYDVYARIFGSQIELLKMLDSIEGKKASTSILIRFHSSTSWRNTYPFFDYINFLITKQLISYNVNSDEYSLTEVGKEFLNFLSLKQLNSIRKQPF